ncbi:MAG TPA: adenylate/guanylate cyclase domain-containing protein [Candidatus Dormibacteraeota bacterium]|jgi:class 3 adenylate cyclase|nr:adenylate/guanylate cyclase domain-containing protein [Candidatus Dormibacteraeota bacterium]
MEPELRYAKSGDYRIAYGIWGDGPVDLLIAPGGFGMFEAGGHVSLVYPRLASFARVITYTIRGSGFSDPAPLEATTTMEERVDDALAVLDDAGVAKAVFLGNGYSGPDGIFLASTFPDRVSSLILYDTYARWTRADDYPAGMPAESAAKFRKLVVDLWGSGGTIAGMQPSLAGDPLMQRDWAMQERISGSAQQVDRLVRMYFDTDVRDVLPTVRVPTLVLHRTGDLQFRIGHGRYLAERIPGATFTELAGSDYLPVGDDLEAFAVVVEEFVTGRPSFAADDRVLATVLFTDIVDSTSAAATLGDRAWRQLLDRHDDTVNRQIERHRGTAVKQTGDGVAATFDGPARAIRCACAIRDAVRPLGLEIRAGLHTGEIEIRGQDVSGLGVHIAARVADLAGAGEVLVSSTVKDLVVGSGISFEDRGMHALKGVPDEWRLLSVVG